MSHVLVSIFDGSNYEFATYEYIVIFLLKRFGMDGITELIIILGDGISQICDLVFRY